VLLKTKEISVIPKPKPLTQAERNWFELLQHLLLNPPSKRISFYTVGDKYIVGYDNRFEPEIDRQLSEYESGDVCQAVEKLGCEMYCVKSAMPIHSTAG
jgi:hypothetical protein